MIIVNMADHILESRLIPIVELFGYDKRYEVPKYQREYSWTKDQIQEFINDLQSLSLNDKQPYFFGAMVFVSDENTGSVVFKIVDGQQRMTTSAILIAVIRDILFEKNNKEASNELHKHLQQTDLVTHNTSDIIILSDRNKEFFKKCILTIDIPKNKIELGFTAPSDKSLFEAYKTIYDSLKNSHDDDTDHQKYLITLYDNFVKRFKIIQVIVSSNTYAYRIFETLNNRGLELSQSDLVKNFILEQCDDNDELQNKIFDDWQSIITTLDGISIDDFFHYFWLANYEKIQKQEIYKKLTSILSDKKITVKGLVNDLKTYAEFYEQMLNPKKIDWWENDHIVEQLENLKILNSKMCYVAILVGKDKLSEREDDFSKLIDMCINFFFRYKTIGGKHATQLEALMIKIAKALRDGLDIDRIKEQYFLDSNIYPTDDDFETLFQKTRLTDKISTYVLKKLNEALSTESISNERMYVEHILPKIIRGTEWEDQLQGKTDIDDLDSYVEKYHSRLGNMTLMRKLTGNDKKKSYAEKLSLFYKDSPIKITNMLLDPKWNSDWNSEQIINRQKYFAELAKDIWKI